MGMAWKLRAEAAVRSSGVPYIIVRPVGLVDERGCCSAAAQQAEFGLGRVSRTAVATLCLRALSASTASPSRATPSLASPQSTPPTPPRGAACPVRLRRPTLRGARASCCRAAHDAFHIAGAGAYDGFHFAESREHSMRLRHWLLVQRGQG